MPGMSTSALELAVLRFDGENTAVERYAQARDAAPYRTDVERPEWSRDVGFVERLHNGRLRLRGTFAGHYLDVDETDTVSQRGAREGAATGGLLGVLGGPPGIAVGILVGMIAGGLAGAPDEVEWEPEALVAALRDLLPPSSSAIVMISSPAEVEELVRALGDQAADVRRRALSGEEAAAIEASLSAAPDAGAA